MTEVTQADIARWRKFKGAGMISAVGEYTPQAFWDVLDALEAEREATRPLEGTLRRALNLIDKVTRSSGAQKLPLDWQRDRVSVTIEIKEALATKGDGE